MTQQNEAPTELCLPAASIIPNLWAEPIICNLTHKQNSKHPRHAYMHSQHRWLFYEWMSGIYV